MTIGGAIRKTQDPGLLLVLLLSLFTAIPLMINPGLPEGMETLTHGLRAAEMQRSWERGQIFPRWTEGVAPGFGATIFHAEAELTYYLTGILHFALGFDALDGLRWLLLGSLLLCAGGMYLFCRRRSGRLGAVIAALVYVYSPYIMHSLPYARGAFPELLACATFPLLLWRIDALRDWPSGANFAAVFALGTALVSVDYLTSLMLTVIVIAWLTFETAVQRFNREAGQVDTRSGALAFAALLLGVMAAATFWLPALLESASAITDALAAVGPPELSRHSAPLDQLLSAPPIQDASAIHGLREFRLLGAAQWIAALIGAGCASQLYIVGYRTRHPQAFLGVAFFAMLALTLIFLMTPSAGEMWMGLGFVQHMQFSARLLGPAAACLAIVASANGFWLEKLEARYRIGLVALAVALPIVTAFPLLFVPEWRRTSLDASAPALHQAEMALRGMEPPAADGFIPRAVHSLPISARAAGHLASAFAVAILCFVIWRWRNQERIVRPYWSIPSLANASRYGVLLGGGIAVLTFAVTFREGIAWLKSPPGVALPAQVRRADAFEGGLQLIGFDLGSDSLRVGDALKLNAYWYAAEATDAYHSSFLQLSSRGSAKVQIETTRAGSRGWRESWRAPGTFVDRYEWALPNDLPADEYDLFIGLFNCEQAPTHDCGKGPPSVVVDEDGAALGDRIRLASIRVEAP